MTRGRWAQFLSATCVSAVVACGIELQTAPGSDASTPFGTLPGSDSGELDAPPVPSDSCTAGFLLDARNMLGSLCTTDPWQCRGTARVDGSAVLLTSSDASPKNTSTGVLWHRLGLARSTPFTLTIEVSTSQPDGGGIQGHGFAIAFVEADSGAQEFPGLREGLPATLGINVLEGFRGAAAYVKTYNGGTSGVFALRTTQIPSADPKQLDDWNGSIGNPERFGRTDRTFLRLVIEARPGADPSVAMYRFSDSTFSSGSLVKTITIPLPTMTRLDFVGIAAARGNDPYSQSAHRVERVELSCPPSP